MPGRSRSTLLRALSSLATIAIQGNLAESLLRCGTKSCGCHRDPARRHGPHLYLKFRTREGRSTGLYVPRSHEAEMRRAVAAWAELWQAVLELGQLNREALRARMRRKKQDERAAR